MLDQRRWKIHEVGNSYKYIKYVYHPIDSTIYTCPVLQRNNTWKQGSQVAPLPYFHANWRALCEGPGMRVGQHGSTVVLGQGRVQS